MGVGHQAADLGTEGASESSDGLLMGRTSVQETLAHPLAGENRRYPTCEQGQFFGSGSRAQESQLALYHCKVGLVPDTVGCG